MRASFLGLALCALLLALAGWGPGDPAPPAARGGQEGDPRISERITPVVKAVALVGPTVVNIRTTDLVVRRHPLFSPTDEEFFRRFFGSPLPSQRFKSQSLGSGVLIDRHGYIVTNAHVVARATQIEVVLADGHTRQGELLSMHEESDLAMVKIEPGGDLPAIALGSSSDLMIGETVIALGNPFGLNNSVTTGVLSATGRSISERGRFVFKDVLQIDAPINPGNSGGPLVNILGQLIGINTAIYQEGSGIGFAIPVDRVKRVLEDLLDAGNRKGIWLGATLAVAQGSEKGVRLQGVDPGSPADRAGLLADDLVVAVNGEAVTGPLELEQRILTSNPGDTVQLTVLRDGTRRNFEITLVQRPREPGQVAAEQRLGVRIEPLTPRDAAAAGLTSTVGVRVEAVLPGSPGEQIGLKAGDVLVKLGRRDYSILAGSVVRMREIEAVNDLAEFLREVRTGEKVFVLVVREGHEMSGELTVR